MVCPHMSYNNINKSKGGSVIASASYDQRKNIYDVIEKIVKTPKTQKNDHVETKMLLPKGAPDRYNDPKQIWNDLNRIEKDKTAYRLIFPFQRELSPEQNREVIEKVLYIEFVSKGHPVQLSYHKDENGNDHAHAIPADRQLINGAWAAKKSETQYYLRGTVKEMDENGKVLNPDAVILTLNDKVDTPQLTRQGFLKRDKNGNILFKKGWQELVYLDEDKKIPLLDKNGKPVLVDIREPDYEPQTKIQKMKKNRNSWKPQWKRATQKYSNVSEVGGKKRVRRTWEKCLNEAFKKYQIKNKNGKILKVDFRSYKEQNKERPADEQLIPTKHVGYGFKSVKLREYNENAKRHNAKVERLRTEKQELAKLEKSLAAIETETRKTQMPEPKRTKSKPAEPNQPTKIVPTSPAPTVQTNVAAAATAKTLSVVDGIAGKKVSAPSGKILKKDDFPLTQEERILRELYDDGTLDDLPTHKPKINALKEWSQALTSKPTTPSTGHDRENPKNVAAVLTEEEARSNYKAKAKIRDDSLAALKKDFVKKRYYYHYLEDSWKVQELKSTWEKNLEAAEKEVDILNQNRSWMDKLRGKYYDIPKNKQDELKKLQMEFLVAERQLEKKYPEIRKYPEIPEVKDKMEKFYEKRQANLIINDAKKMGYKDDQELLQKYLNDAAAAKEAFSKIPTAPDDPVTGRNIQQKNHSKTNTAAKKIAPAKTTTPEKKKGKPRS